MLSKGEKQQILFITAYNTHWITEDKRVMKEIIEEWQTGYVTSEERDFKLLCLDRLKDLRDQLLSPHPDATDLWRENLKAWNLKQRELSKIKELRELCKPSGPIKMTTSEEAIRLAMPSIYEDLRSHYKGEF